MENEHTYIGEVGTSVIDYVVVNEKALKATKVVKERNGTESDHIPLEVEVEEEWRELGKKQITKHNYNERKGGATVV